MGYAALISGTPVFPKDGSVQLDMYLNSRNTLSFTLNSNGSYRPEIGAPVGIFESNGTKIFGGSVDKRNEKPFAPFANNPDLYLTVPCVSHDQLLEKRFAYDEQTNRVPVYKSYTGKVEVEGTRVTWLSGDFFDTELKGRSIKLNLQVGDPDITIGPVELLTVAVADVLSPVNMTLESSPQSFTEIAWFFTWTAKSIVQDLVQLCARGEGITTDGVTEGANISKFVGGFEKSLYTCIDDLAKQSNCIWYTDPEKDIKMVPRTADEAPFSITNSTKILGIGVSETREDYRNVEMQKVSFAAFAPKEESFTGDVATFAWELKERIEELVSVELNGIKQEVGILDTQTGERDPGKNFFYSVAERIISQDPAAARLTANDELLVRYRVLGSNVIVQEDPDKIAERAAAEPDTSGKYAHFTDDSGNTGAIDGQAKAIATLQVFGTIPKTLTYRTCAALIPSAIQLRPGQIQQVTLAKFGLNEAFLIKQVSVTDGAPRASDNLKSLWYTVTAVTGTYVADYLDVFKKFLDKGGSQSVAQSSGGGSDPFIKISYDWRPNLS